MAITIGGIRLTNVSLTVDNEGKLKTTGSYELRSNNDIVIAKQGFNSYSEITLTESAETKKLCQDVLAGIKRDLTTTLGLD